MLTRRGMLFGLGAALAAPAIVRADSLMKLYVPKPYVIPQTAVGYIDISQPISMTWASGATLGNTSAVPQRMWLMNVGGKMMWKIVPDSANGATA